MYRLTENKAEPSVIGMFDQILKKAKELFQDTRGAAMVEGAVLLPLMITVFVGMVFLFQVYESKLEASNMSRSCAWHYSQQNCKDGKMPAGYEMPSMCQKEQSNVRPSAELSAEMAKLNAETSSLAEKEVPEELGSMEKALVPLVDMLTGAMGLSQEKIISANRTSTNPLLFGGGTTTAKNKYAILCNEQPKTGLQVIEEIWSATWN